MRGTKRRLKGNPTQIFTLLLRVDRANDFWRYFRSLSDDFSHFPRLKLVLDSSKGSFWGSRRFVRLHTSSLVPFLAGKLSFLSGKNRAQFQSWFIVLFWGHYLDMLIPRPTPFFTKRRNFFAFFSTFPQLNIAVLAAVHVPILERKFI